MDRLSRDTETLAARLAEARGVSPEEAVTLALKESLERIKANEPEPKPTGSALIHRMQEISARYRALPILDPRSPDEILGYDEFGLPT